MENVSIIEPYFKFWKFYKDVIDYRGKYSFLKNYVFRGHASNNWELVPSALRDSEMLRQYVIANTNSIPTNIFHQVVLEKSILEDFYKKANYNVLKVPEMSTEDKYYIDDEGDEVDVPYWTRNGYLKLAALAQHYGLPTRLLDWTYELNTAIYFAVIGNIDKNNRSNGDFITIWAIDYRWFRPHTNNWSNEKLKFNQLSFESSEYYNNKNLGAQKGLFSFWIPDMNVNYIDKRPLDVLLNEAILELNSSPTRGIHNSKNNFLYRIDIHKCCLEDLYSYLSDTNSTASKQFPDYYGAVREINEDAIFLKRNKYFFG